MRWEMRPRLFLRTAEFLWQEGHTAHETKAEALEETKMIHQLYADALQDLLAIPVIMGEKTEAERFPGAESTLTVEAMVQDKKAIQAGTSHYLGQNFAKAQDITFVDRDNKEQYVHTTSWGVSTRLVGTLIMAHSDDDGLVLPPRIAPQQIVIVPVTPKEDSRDPIVEACEALASQLRDQYYGKEPLRVHVDKRDLGGGVKKWEWVKKGVPLRVEIGPRDLEEGKVCLQRRDQAPNEKSFISQEEFLLGVVAIIENIHTSLLDRARRFRDENIIECNDLDYFEKHWKDSNQNPGWLVTPWAGTREEEEEISKRLKISIRCLPIDWQDESDTPCFMTGKPTKSRAIWGRSY
jgi:prolyl-tRNA synthetase